jgi:hypothetical protein
MSFLRRVELWVLLAIAVAGILFAFSSRHRDAEQGAAGAAGAGAMSEDPPLKLHRCVLKRDYGTARLDIELRVRNAGGQKLVLQPPDAILVTGKGREVPGFYLPFEPQPEVGAGSAQDVLIRYWLTADDLAGTLTFEVRGARLEVKSAKAFDLNSVPNLETRIFKPGEW